MNIDISRSTAGNTLIQIFVLQTSKTLMHKNLTITTYIHKQWALTAAVYYQKYPINCEVFSMNCFCTFQLFCLMSIIMMFHLSDGVSIVIFCYYISIIVVFHLFCSVSIIIIRFIFLVHFIIIFFIILLIFCSVHDLIIR